MTSFDADAASVRLEAHILSLYNTHVDPPEKLVRSVFDLDDDNMRIDNVVHPMPSVGMIYDGKRQVVNAMSGGGFEVEGRGTWGFVLMCDSPVRGQGMRGPRGAMTIAMLLEDGLNNFHVDGEADEDEDGDGGKCPLTVTEQKRFVPTMSATRAVCGYSLVASHPLVST